MVSSNTNGAAADYSYAELNSAQDGNRQRAFDPSVTSARPATGTTSYSYDPAGNLSGYVHPNGVQTSYTYDTLNRSTYMAISKTTTLGTVSYTLGRVGQSGLGYRTQW